MARPGVGHFPIQWVYIWTAFWNRGADIWPPKIEKFKCPGGGGCRGYELIGALCIEKGRVRRVTRLSQTIAKVVFTPCRKNFPEALSSQAAQAWGEGWGDSRYKEMYGNLKWQRKIIGFAMKFKINVLYLWVVVPCISCVDLKPLRPLQLVGIRCGETPTYVLKPKTKSGPSDPPLHPPSE